MKATIQLKWAYEALKIIAFGSYNTFTPEAIALSALMLIDKLDRQCAKIKAKNRAARQRKA